MSEPTKAMERGTCQKCGTVGGTVLSWFDTHGLERSLWFCPECVERDRDEARTVKTQLDEWEMLMCQTLDVTKPAEAVGWITAMMRALALLATEKMKAKFRYE